MSDRGNDRPLDGHRVVVVAGGVATRYCGRLLARLGAHVVEVRDAGADDRRIGFGGDAGIVYGRWLDDAKEVVESMSAVASTGRIDVVVAGQDGAAVEEAAAFAGRVDGAPVLLALTWFHLGGPYAVWQGSDEVIHALTGVAYSFGRQEGPPTIPQGHGPQVMAGAHAANLAMAALLVPPVDRPRRIELDVLETALCLSEVGAVATIDDPAQRSMRLGVNRYSPTYPCSSYRTSDGWAGVTCLTPAQWQAMCHLIGRPDVADDPRFRTSFRRLLLGDEVDAVLAPAFATRTTAQWVTEGIAHRIPIAPMLRPSELPGHPHWAGRGSFGPVDPDEPSVVAPTLPFLVRAHPTGGSPSTASTAKGGHLLSGLRVLDFTMGWAGPQATRWLGDLGADVVKVESADHPDWYRGWEANSGGDPPPIEVRSSFNTLNRNKLGVVLELGTETGRRQAEQLLAGADVVIENFAAGVLDRLGLSAREQRRLAPTAVTLSMPAFGNGGPLTGIRAYGSTVEQASGLPFVNGEEEWPPSLQHVAYGDAVAGIYAVTAILCGLHARRSGAGVELDLAQVACLFELAADAVIAEQVEGSPRPRTGSRRARLAHCEVVRCAGADSWVVVATDAVERLPEHLATWSVARTPAEAAHDLQQRGIAAAPVLAVHDLGTDPHLVSTAFWETMDRRYVGHHTLGAPAFRIDGRRPVARMPAPTLGEHTGDVLEADGDPWTRRPFTGRPSAVDGGAAPAQAKRAR